MEVLTLFFKFIINLFFKVMPINLPRTDCYSARYDSLNQFRMRSLSFKLAFLRLPNVLEYFLHLGLQALSLELPACLHHILVQELLVPLASSIAVPTGPCLSGLLYLPLRQQQNWKLTSSCKA